MSASTPTIISNALRGLLAGAALAGATLASAHVTLANGSAPAGSDYEAAFRVGHACKDTQATTGIRVQLPAGFTLHKAEPRAGWSLATAPGEVSWKAQGAQNALPTTERAQFVLRGKLGDQPGPIWFKVLQTCDSGSADWAQVPVAGATQKPEFPAARLDVLPAGAAAVEVSGAWVRQAVPGQSGTGAFMTLKAAAGLRLVGAATPVAGVAEVHEMKMEGDTMRMRAVAGGLALPPGESVALRPGGNHLMLMDLKQPLAAGAQVPLTLQFEDAKGTRSTLSLQVPVAAAAPGGAASQTPHKH